MSSPNGRSQSLLFSPSSRSTHSHCCSARSAGPITITVVQPDQQAQPQARFGPQRATNGIWWVLFREELRRWSFRLHGGTHEGETALPVRLERYGAKAWDVDHVFLWNKEKFGISLCGPLVGMPGTVVAYARARVVYHACAGALRRLRWDEGWEGRINTNLGAYRVVRWKTHTRLTRIEKGHEVGREHAVSVKEGKQGRWSLGSRPSANRRDVSRTRTWMRGRTYETENRIGDVLWCPFFFRCGPFFPVESGDTESKTRA